MHDSILIPVDLSTTNEHVLATARELASSDQTDLQLLHVIETLQDEEPGELAEHDFEVQSTIVYGERGPEVTRVAEEEDMDLIVLRSHRVDRDEPDANVGTVSHQIAVFAPCSVYLVRP
ncbi:MAG: hypothetical protein BRD31_03460 [Bacteroidetes bacterium QH_2_64_26]|nr:MAG: hypothetical protein BRD31_03460 [Bacteroidetes bacterium QH_2_64_26]